MNNSNNLGRNNPHFSIDDEDLDDEADVGASRSETNLYKYNLNDIKKKTDNAK